MLTLRRRPGEYAVCRFAARAVPPSEVWGEGLVAVVTTEDEVTVVCPVDRAPEATHVEPGWTAYSVDGPLDFGLTGIMAGLTTALAEAGVPVFVLSSYDTDHLLVRTGRAAVAERAWIAAGHHVDSGA